MAPRMAIDIKNTEKLEVEGGSPEKGNRQSSAGKPEPIGIRWCCGNSIEPTLTQYPNGCPGKLFLALWQCPKCGDFSAEYIWE